MHPQSCPAPLDSPLVPAPGSHRILHILAPAYVGGLERVVHALALEQARRGHDVHVVMFAYGPGEPPLSRDLAAAGINNRVVHVAARGYLAERRAARDIIRQLRPDVVHTHGLRVDVVTGAVPRALGIPSVATVHGRTGGGVKMRMYEWAHFVALRRRDAVVAVSRPLIGLLTASGIRANRIHFIPNAWRGASSGLTREAARAALGIGRLDERSRVAIFVGRLSREKGADVLVRAIAALGDRAVHAVIVGAGTERDALGRLASREGIADRVHFPGAIADAGQLLAAADVFVLSSRTEGTPIALFEAMGARVPIVATAVGGVPDVVSEREALLVPSERPDSLANAIRMALTDRVGAQRRAAAAAERLAAGFATEPWAGRHDVLYDALIERAARGASHSAIPR
jgi:glycosyltransferase involved in cell wall biosynthesis